MYDLDGDNVISAQELYSMLHSILGNAYTDKQLEQVVQRTMVQYDQDGDWTLTYNEFVKLMNTTDLQSKFVFPI